MNIAILCPVFYNFDGISRVAKNQASEYTAQGNTVEIFTLAANMEPPANVKLHVLGLPNWFLAEKIYRLLFPLDFITGIRCISKLKNFDVMYSHLYPMHWLAYLAKNIHGVRFVYYNHHLNPPQVFPTLIEQIYARLRFVSEKWLIKGADEAISISQYSRECLKRDIGLDSEVIYNKVDTIRFHLGIDGSMIRERHNLANDPVVLFVGHISPSKGVELLIQAFNIAKREMPNAKLLIVGKHLYKNYSKQLKQISDESVIFTGPVSDEDLPQYYAACNIYATAALWEGFNLPLVEAQACGKPVVAFDIGPHLEVITDSKIGMLIQPIDIEGFAMALTSYIK